MPVVVATNAVLEAKKSVAGRNAAVPNELVLKVRVAEFVVVATPMKEFAEETLYEAMPVEVASPVKTLPCTPLILMLEVVMYPGFVKPMAPVLVLYVMGPTPDKDAMTLPIVVVV